MIAWIGLICAFGIMVALVCIGGADDDKKK